MRPIGRWTVRWWAIRWWTDTGPIGARTIMPDRSGPPMAADHHMMMPPVRPCRTENGRDNADANAKKDSTRNGIVRRPVTRRWRPVIRWVIRIAPTAIHHQRVVIRHIEITGPGRFDINVVVLHDDALLLIRQQCAGIAGIGTQALHRGHHIALLIDKGIADGIGPIRLIVQHRNHRWKLRQCLDAIVPWLILHGIRKIVAIEALTAVEEIGSIGHIVGIGGGDQHLREQFVRVQSNRRQHRFKLLLGIRLRLRQCRRDRKRRRKDQSCHPPEEGFAHTLPFHGRGKCREKPSSPFTPPVGVPSIARAPHPLLLRRKQTGGAYGVIRW